MGKASSSKKVARAASTGGGRTSRGRTPWVWYSVMSLVVVLGVLGVYTSRSDLSQAAADPPAIGDHWHAAFAVVVCGKELPPLPENMAASQSGIHTHGDGLIHIEPRSASGAGKNARLGRFLEAANVDVTATKLKVPGDDKQYADGGRCGGKKADVQVGVWETPDDETVEIVKGAPGNLRLKQAQVIVVAFVAEGAELKKPASAGKVTEADEPPGGQPPISGGSPTTGAATTGAPTTAAPAGTGASTTPP